VRSATWVPVGGAFHHVHRWEVRWLKGRPEPLIDAVVRDAVEAALAVRPRLRSGPLGAVVEIFGFARREMIDDTGRAPAAAPVEAHAGIVMRHPFLRIDHLPALVEVARSGGHVRVRVGHALPSARIAVLKSEALG